MCIISTCHFNILLYIRCSYNCRSYTLAKPSKKHKENKSVSSDIAFVTIAKLSPLFIVFANDIPHARVLNHVKSIKENYYG